MAKNSDINKLADRFIQLANKIKQEGVSPEDVNGGLMFASCIYSTYVAAGNDGYVKESGINKITSVFRHNLAALQKIKKDGIENNNQ